MDAAHSCTPPNPGVPDDVNPSPVANPAPSERPACAVKVAEKAEPQLPPTPARRVTPELVEKVLAAQRMTIKDVLLRFRNSPKAKHDARELRRIDFLLRTENFRNFFDLNVYTFNEEDVSLLIDYRIDEASTRLIDLSGHTINKDLSCINSAIAHAATHEYAKGLITPINSSHFTPPTKRCVERLDKKAEAVLFEFGRRYEEMHTVPLATIMTILLGTGMRRSEIANIRKQDYDFRLSHIHLPKTKNGTTREVPLPSELNDLFSKLTPRSDGNFFPSADSISIAWHRMREAAAAAVEKEGNLELAAIIRAVRIHDLRHEAISRLVSKGHSDVQVMTIVGLRSPKMLSYYTKFRPSELVELVNKLEDQYRASHPCTSIPPVVTAPQQSEDHAAWKWVCNNPPAFQALLNQHPKTAIASMFNISDVAVGKAAVKLGLVVPKRGYWLQGAAH